MEKPGSVDEMMQKFFFKTEQFQDRHHWEGFRWGIKTAWVQVAAFYTENESEELKKLLGFLEASSEMSKRREQWCLEKEADKHEE